MLSLTEISCAKYVISEKAVSFAFKVRTPPYVPDFRRAAPLERVVRRRSTYLLYLSITCNIFLAF